MEIPERYGNVFMELEVEGISLNYVRIVLLLVFNAVHCPTVHAYQPYLWVCFN